MFLRNPEIRQGLNLEKKRTYESGYFLLIYPCFSSLLSVLTFPLSDFTLLLYQSDPLLSGGTGGGIANIFISLQIKAQPKKK